MYTHLHTTGVCDYIYNWIIGDSSKVIKKSYRWYNTGFQVLNVPHSFAFTSQSFTFLSATS